MTTRPKRLAALKSAAIIEISDSDEDVTPAKRSRTDRSSNVSIDRAAKRTIGNTEQSTDKPNQTKKSKEQRWPTKEKASESNAMGTTCSASKKSTARSKGKTKGSATVESQSIENIPPNLDAIELVEFTDATQSAAQASGRNEVSSAQAQQTVVSRASGRRSSLAGPRKAWNIHELLAETQHIDNNTAQNIVQLFENQNTIPFICRYRRDLVNHLSPERVRDIKNSYTEIVNLRKKAETIVAHLEKEQVVTEDVRTDMLCAKTSEELEFLYAPYKPANKGSLAERAKAMGLEPYAECLLFGEEPAVRLESLVNHNNPDLDTTEKVSNGICHIISHNISKDTEVLAELRRLRKVHRIVLKSTQSKSAANPKEQSTTTQAHHGNVKNDKSKYELYFDFQADVRYMKPHQILAINRGEKFKFLSIKIVVADYVKTDIKRYVYGLYMEYGLRYELRHQIFEKAFEECYTKKLQPLLSRQIRADLNEAAKKAAIDVFAQNLKQLLLMSPLKGERILGIDPGFTNGCKLALISETADVLETGVLYPHKRNNDPEECGYKLQKMLSRHNCKIIALGNGTACRETEFWLGKLFSLGILDANTMRYSIVSEQGASIYSCSDVAQKEFPNMDTNEISAVSIARRLNDPLSEYVKIEPRHIGVGMYQHDVNEKVLSESLNEVVSECVSYVGVDLNTASLSVLRHVAGLTEKKADQIIQFRLANGPFLTRKDLLKVKSIGEKSFVQCAGFIRIEPRSVGGKIQNLLDCTWVHPESYAVAENIINRCKLRLNDMGTPRFISTINTYTEQSDLIALAKQLKIPKERLEIVLIALKRELFQDYRSDLDKRPLFKQGITRLSDLSEGDVVTGAVTNITHFGAFVDIGVECDGLIHSSKMKRATLNIGDRVTASIVQVDVKRRRIGLKLEDMLKETDTSFTFA